MYMHVHTINREASVSRYFKENETLFVNYFCELCSHFQNGVLMNFWSKVTVMLLAKIIGRLQIIDRK